MTHYLHLALALLALFMIQLLINAPLLFTKHRFFKKNKKKTPPYYLWRPKFTTPGHFFYAHTWWREFPSCLLVLWWRASILRSLEQHRDTTLSLHGRGHWMILSQWETRTPKWSRSWSAACVCFVRIAFHTLSYPMIIIFAGPICPRITFHTLSYPMIIIFAGPIRPNHARHISFGNFSFGKLSCGHAPRPRGIQLLRCARHIPRARLAKRFCR